jgi:SAM-dependent methyltransferase
LFQKGACCYPLSVSATTSSAPASPAGFVRAAAFHYGRIVINAFTAVHAVKSALAATPDERVLDFGCGCGWFCAGVPGDYLGIDLNPDYIGFARWRWGSPRRRFEVRRLEDLPADEPFDKAIMASALHHLSDDVAETILERLRRLVRRRLVVLELDPDRANRFQRLLLDRDRGEYIRPVARQRAVLERHFTVAEERRFQSTTRTVAHVLFTCVPRP